MMVNCFCRMVDRQKGIKLYIHLRRFLEVLTITNLQHTRSKTIQPLFRSIHLRCQMPDDAISPNAPTYIRISCQTSFFDENNHFEDFEF